MDFFPVSNRNPLQILNERDRQIGGGASNESVQQKEAQSIQKWKHIQNEKNEKILVEFLSFFAMPYFMIVSSPQFCWLSKLSTPNQPPLPTTKGSLSLSAYEDVCCGCMCTRHQQPSALLAVCLNLRIFWLFCVSKIVASPHGLCSCLCLCVCVCVCVWVGVLLFVRGCVGVVTFLFVREQH